MAESIDGKTSIGNGFAVRDLKADEVTFTITCEDEHEAVRGAFDSGEPELDRETEEAILKRIDKGDTWAWCGVKVTATWEGLSGSDYLGCCSYESEKNFKETSGYFDDMKTRALDDLNETLAKLGKSIAARVEVSE